MRFLAAIVILVFTAKAENLTIGWSTQKPYQVEKRGELTGIDVQFAHEILENAGFRTKFVKLEWDERAQALIDNKVDIIIGAVQDSTLTQAFRSSIPYRHEQQSLFSRQKLPRNPRIGIMNDALASNPSVTTEKDNFIRYDSVAQLLEALQNRSIDGFIADQLAGGTLLWDHGLNNIIRFKSLAEILPVYFVYSHKVPQESIGKLNTAISSFKKSENYKKIYRKYHHPIVFAQTLNQPWFFIIDIIGTIAFAISGVIIAYRERMTLFGAFFMAILPAVGGGVTRDILVGRSPIFIIANPYYLYAILSTVLVSFLFIKCFGHREKFPKKELTYALEVFDALGLASFAIIGVWVALMRNVQPFLMWGPLLGGLTASGGGIIRDLFRSDHYYASLKGRLYPEVAIFWAFCLSAYMHLQHENLTLDQAFWAVITCIAGAFLTRLYAYLKGWQSPTLRFVNK